MSDPFSLNRRSALAGAGAFAAASLALRPGGAQAKPVADALPLNDPAFHLRTLVRLQGDLSGAMLYAYSAGQVFGVRPGQGFGYEDVGRRLYGYEGCSVRRTYLRPDGKFETKARSWLFYKDLETGEYIKEFHNPYTDKKVPVPFFRAGITAEVLGPNGLEFERNFTMKSTVFGKPIRLDFLTVGDQAMITRHTFTEYTPAGAKKSRTEFTMDAWHCTLADLANPRLPRIPSSYAWTSITEWQTWLGMPPEIEGQLLWRSEGATVKSIEELPERFVAHCMAENPELLSSI